MDIINEAKKAYEGLSEEEKTTENEKLRAQITELLDTLTERERGVITMRFGLEDGHPRTLEETAKQYDVTRERIRQIEAKALKKLRHPESGRKLRDYLE